MSIQIPQRPSIQDAQLAVHATATDKDWWTVAEVMALRDINLLQGEELEKAAQNILAKLMLVVTEVAEAGECVRDGEFKTILNRADKPLGLPIELADIVIRVMDLAGAMDIDLQEAIRIKAAYNLSRPQKHGGKLA